jgi:hypothetical protein
MLSVEKVLDIHHQGGTILASARGGFDNDIIINFLLKHGINQLYIIGGFISPVYFLLSLKCFFFFSLFKVMELIVVPMLLPKNAFNEN